MESGEPKESAAQADIQAHIPAALDIYKMDNGVYPNTQQGLRVLHGHYSKKVFIDPWGRDYIYISPGIRNQGSYDLLSLGADGIASQDDIK